MDVRARIRGDNNTVINHKTVEVHFHHHYADGPAQPETFVHRVCAVCEAIIGMHSDDVLCRTCRKAATEREFEWVRSTLVGGIMAAFVLAALTVNLCRQWTWDVPWSTVMPLGTGYAVVAMVVITVFHWRRFARQRRQRRR